MHLRTSALVALLVFASASAQGGDPVVNIVTVTNTDDAGSGSLRQALLDAAATPATQIHFAIPGNVVHTIVPATALPAVAASTTIDGTTQLGTSCATAPPNLRIEIDGSSLPAGSDALTVSGAGVTIRGLVVNSAPRNGIHVGAVSGFSLGCSYVGTDVLGVLDYGNGENGIWLDGSSGAQIGGPASADANLISSNTLSGILVTGASATDNQILRNRIGLTVLDDSLPNGGSGVLLQDGANANDVGTIGGGNEIHHNEGGGVTVVGDGAIGNSIRGNSLAANGSIGIDLLGEFFEDANDPGDPDVGPNRLQNTPVLESASNPGGLDTLEVTFSVDSNPANAAYPLAIDLYGADSDEEEGATYLGTVPYSASDFATGSVTYVVPGAPVFVGQRIVATATDAAGNTSEYCDDAVTVPEPTSVALALAAFGALALRRRSAEQ